MGACGVSFAPANTPAAAQTPHDCVQAVCDGSGNVTPIPDDTDLPLDDDNSCTAEACSAGAPIYPAKQDGEACTDGDACTQTDTCQAGACIGADPVVCSALDQCHVAGTCDPITGACDNPNQADGTTCDDGDTCTNEGACLSGVCQPGAPTCAAGAPAGTCHVQNGACDAGTGACAADPLPAGASCGADLVCTASGACVLHVVLNEVESSGGVPGDWVELFNAGAAPADVSGWKLLDNDDAHTAYVLPAGTTIAPGGSLLIEEASFGFGFGAADTARLFDASGALVDSHTWSTHAATTYGRCPNGAGPFTTTTSVTKGAANDCSIAVRINEVESSDGAPGDWAELYNGGPAVDISGWVFKDNDNAHAYVIPPGTTLAAGDHFVLEEAALGFGLDAMDSARLFDPQGTLVDSYSWTSHAATTYGRCPNGTGAFTETMSATKGSGNTCSGGPPPVPAWPGANMVTTVDGASAFGINVSGLFYDPAVAPTPSVLWAVRNNPSLLFKLVFDGSIWTSDSANGWGAGKTLRYSDGTGVPDAEDVTKAELPSSAVYVATERDNNAAIVSRMSILRFDTDQPGAELIATHEWNLNADLPVVGPNLGLEAITWIPDAFLVANSFFDEAAGHTYDPAEYPNHGMGLFFVGLEANGMIYAYALDHAGGGFTRIATATSGSATVKGLYFDRDVGYLWRQCGAPCMNQHGVLAIDDVAGSPTFGKLTLIAQFMRPSTMPDVANEGIAIVPESECMNGFKSFFWADDSQTGGHALRLDFIPCGPFIP
jgi:hypothetical protein